LLIPILVEPNYRNSIWAQQTLDGLLQEATHRKYETRLLEGDYRRRNYEGLFCGENPMVVIVGTSISWMPDVLAFFTERGIASILISFDPSESTALRGIVRMDYIAATHTLLSYLSGCGRNRIALYGFNPNSSADTIKLGYFESWNKVNPHADEPNVFPNQASLTQCYALFAAQHSRFDAVICANDVAAASLLRHLKSDRIPVPERLFLTSYGNTVLSERVEPPITSVSLDHEEMGRQAVMLYAYLYRQKISTNVSVRVRSKLMIRQSTAMTPVSAGCALIRRPAADFTSDADFYSDPEAQLLLSVERLLTSCDDTDIRLLDGLIAGKAYRWLEEHLFLPSSTLRYRIKRIMKLMGCDTRRELIDHLMLCCELGIFQDPGKKGLGTL
jgi:DNA-binding LacI/PurR family transcriptional regulator